MYYYSPLPLAPINTADSPIYLFENLSSPIDVSDTTVRLTVETVRLVQSALIEDVLSIHTFSCPLVGTWIWKVEEGDCWKGDLAMPWSSVTPDKERDYEGANLTRE